MWGRSYDREELLSQPFPESWEACLRENVYHFRHLNDDERACLRNDARLLVAEKNWEGCGGLKLTDKIKLTVAGQAGLLLLGIEHDVFSRVKSVLIYPSTFLIPGGAWMDDPELGYGADGEAVYRGPVILSWDNVLAEGQDPSSGENLVIHEFAHQLDSCDGEFNGTPLLATAEFDKRWRKVMAAEYNRLRRDLDEERETVLGDYAATNESEFFAVASERFFTVPKRLRKSNPALYELLKEYYGSDPVRWFRTADANRE